MSFETVEEGFGFGSLCVFADKAEFGKGFMLNGLEHSFVSGFFVKGCFADVFEGERFASFGGVKYLFGFFLF